MNELTIFKNDQFGEVRTITIEGEPWFVAADVCKALELDKTWNALQRLDDDEKGTTSISTPGGIQNMSIVNEPGLYTLVLGSRKKEAKEFKRWITHIVIPAIRKTGSYVVGEEKMDDDELIAQGYMALQRKLELRTAELAAANKKVESLQPKAAYYDTVAAADGLTSFRETAKLFKVAEKTFTKFIEESNLCYRDSHKRLIPYAERQKSSWFEVKEVTITTSTGIKTTIYTKITPKGRTEIFKRLQTAGVIKPWETEVLA